MALEEHAKEDLLRQATQFQRRALLQRPDGMEIFIGLRSSGASSVYLSQEFVIHFNSNMEIRRLFDHGQKLAANCGHLESLVRTRRGGRVEFVRERMSEQDEQRLLERCHQDMERLANEIDTFGTQKIDTLGTKQSRLVDDTNVTDLPSSSTGGSAETGKLVLIGQVPEEDRELFGDMSRRLRQAIVDLSIAELPSSGH